MLAKLAKKEVGGSLRLGDGSAESKWCSKNILDWIHENHIQ
jgi:hypothetical protein